MLIITCMSISFCLGMLTMAFIQFGTQATIDTEKPENEGDELSEESED